MNKRQYADWKAEGKLTMADRLNARVKQIIEAECEPRLSEAELRAYDEIIERRAKEIAEGKFHREHFV
jgi:trimethylamine:corrinoid methyltransferase-like protein